MNTLSPVLVLIPHFNNPKGLEKSLASIVEKEILNVLIVDDGSNSDMLFKPEELNNKFKEHLILHFHYLKENQGIEYALNEGLKCASKENYTYIARLDCDDTCYHNRFKIQFDYLKSNPSVKLLGTQVKHINEEGEELYLSHLPLSYEKIKKAFYINCEIYHPTVMFHLKTVLDIGMYPLDFRAAEDYALFFEVIRKHKAENLDIILVDKLIDEQSISSRNRKRQIKSRIKVMRKNFYFGALPIYGILRSYVLYLLPRKAITRFNSIFKN